MVPISCSYKYDEVSVDRDAKVLSVNENIMRGEMIGEFLTSASGSIANDVNIIGVSYPLGNDLFLEDLEVKHSILAYYRGQNTLPIEVKFEKWHGGRYRMVIRINGYSVYSGYYSHDGIDRILDEEMNNVKTYN
jgi:hypothetical protein